ncbi:MAG: hypothetical protein ACREBW_05110, partial [Candidatus Micrarchaeaceae archaeon]
MSEKKMIRLLDIAGVRQQIDRYPDYCPVCHIGIIPTPVYAQKGTVTYGAQLEVVYACPNSKCAELFIAYFYAPATHYESSARVFLRMCRP